MSSDFPYISLEKALKDTYPYKNSKNAGTSYCNYIYYKALEYLQENRSDTKVVFIHIPYYKNISDFGKLCSAFDIIGKVLST